jgi:hypothetical protein
MTYSRVEQAARNNAVWCETICRVHGTPGEFHDTLWLNRHPVPRFYPNVVTLAPQAGTATQLAHIHALDLAVLGFQPLFDGLLGEATRWALVTKRLLMDGCVVHCANDTRPRSQYERELRVDLPWAR